MLADAASVPYVGHTSEGRRIVLEVRGRTVVHVRAGLRHYRCETFDDVGPVVVAEGGRAHIARDGRFAFAAGEPAQRLLVRGRLRAGGVVRGTLRVQGTIATGQRCASAALRFRAARQASSGASGSRSSAASMSASENSGSSSSPARKAS
jgi:hypothetical protein